MNIARKDQDALNATLTIQVAKADYQEKVDNSLKEYRKKANMPGFRPGKVPAALVKKMYGKAVLVEEINKLVSEELYKYIKDEKINTLGDPLASENQKDVDFDNDEDFEFSFDLGLAPEVVADIDDKTKIAYYDIEIDDQMIDDQVKSYASRFGSYSNADESAEEDMLKGNIEQVSDDENAIKAENVIICAKYIKDENIKKSFVGNKVGDIIKFNPKKAYDNNAEVASLLKISTEAAANVYGDFNFAINEITRYTPSEVNQDLFDKVYGKDAVKDEKAFKEKIKEDIQKTLNDDSDYKFSIDARKAFIEKNAKIEMPEAFLKRWALTTNKDLTEEKLEKDFNATIDELKWHLVQEKIAADQKIQVEDNDIDNFAKKVAKAQFAQYGMSNVPEDILNNYVADMRKDQKAMQNMVNGVINEKINNVIKEKVTLEHKKISLDDFNKLLQDNK